MSQPDEDLILGDHLEPGERDPEAPAVDAVEQATPAYPTDDAAVVHRGLEVGEYDAAEQARVVAFEEDYR